MVQHVARKGTGLLKLFSGLGLAAGLFLAAPASFAQSPNLGDPLFCQPQEGTGFLIVNGGAGVFTVNEDCYSNNVNNDTQLSIATTRGGSLTGTRDVPDQAINYVYTPPTPGFTGTDTFNINVTTVFNGAGGPGSAGGAVRPGGPATLTVTLNVLPATTVLNSGDAPILVPVPAGSITGCQSGVVGQGNGGQGPPASAISGCVTGVMPGTIAPAHGTLTLSGNTVRYTPNGSFTGHDSFTYQAVGINTDGTNALNSGDIVVNIAPIVPALSPGAIALMAAGLLLLGIRMLRGRFV